MLSGGPTTKRRPRAAGFPVALATIGMALALTAAAAIVLPAVAESAKAPEHGYVSSAIAVPATNTEARSLGRDIDGDGDSDNRLGQFFVALESQGLDLQGAFDAAVTDGDLLMLHSLKTPSLANSKQAIWQVLYAEPTAAPDFSGSGSFTVANAPRSLKLPAKIKNRHVSTAAGAIPVQLTMGAGVFTLNLKDAKVFATCSRSGCTAGRINGVITTQQVNTDLIPKLAEQFNAIVPRDCTGINAASCADESEGKQLVLLFDANHDMVISAEELRTNPLTQAVLAPDLDLEKANGKPGHDGVADALSVGVGFVGVRGQLVRP